MTRILITDGMEQSGVLALKNAGFEVVEEFYEPDILKEKIKEFDVIVVRSATKVRKPIIDAALETKQLKLVIRGGVGVDNIDVEYAMENGIKVMNTPLASSASVAELAIGHMFAIARHIHMANVTMRDGKWNKKQYEGIELGGKTLGLIGFGRIAKETAKRAKALGMNVIYTNRSGKVEGADEYTYIPFNELLAQSDFISLHIPAGPEGKAIIGKAEFEMMKDGVYIINTARGGVVCEKALLEALDSGKVAAAAIDVFEEEPTKNEALYTHDKISLTPHIGASTGEAQTRIGEEIVDIITKFFK
ncbi:D-3-phosphoglycerate dehydrogenase [Anaerosolibacter carboniphilus]|uniref:D-3-phosphoglycerate dehydrogenase n=1 Tax=Anaerosolibacter carboniphilus TaxID=1417629 RepID=A0A841KM31_9FIRM|nr:D-2-hydroxyacid dehydrogenase [Anaerosolibacter carboniphilus]MBB6214864.1 D-3-phosphoglycerate dehydrogenase [Anaerosolibacter carboniphilus]